MVKNFKIDPLQFFPYEICEEIFKNLPVKDLLKASCVSSDWYDFVAKSQRLMTKVKVKTNCNMDQEYSKKIISALIKSERKYENLEVERCAQCLHEVYGLLESKKWKQVSIIRTSFSSPQESVEFFKFIEENVEELIMNAVYVRQAYSDGVNKGLMFPKLKYFSARNIQSFLFHEVFQNIQHLENFDLFSNDQSVTSLNTVMNFLKVNKGLKCLHISGSVFYQILYQDISNLVSFKLKQLIIANGSYHSGEFYNRIYKNLASFLKQQGDSLENVSIDDWMGETVLSAIYLLPNLKELTIKGFTHIYENIDWSKLNLKTNTSIVKMHIAAVPDDLKLLKAIITATPKLRYLSISLMNIHFMSIISHCSQQLTSLKIGYLNITNIPKKNWFKNLKFLDIRNYRSCLKENITKKSNDKLNSFEKMVFDVIKY